MVGLGREHERVVQVVDALEVRGTGDLAKLPTRRRGDLPQLVGVGLAVRIEADRVDLVARAARRLYGLGLGLEGGLARLVAGHVRVAVREEQDDRGYAGVPLTVEHTDGGPKALAYVRPVLERNRVLFFPVPIYMEGWQILGITVR